MKRDRSAIRREILELCAVEACRVTQIVYAVGLNFMTVRPYLQELEDGGLLKKTVVGKVRNPGYKILYETTQAGITAAGMARASGLI